jgi:hypothetical protein
MAESTEVPRENVLAATRVPADEIDATFRSNTIGEYKLPSFNHTVCFFRESEHKLHVQLVRLYQYSGPLSHRRSEQFQNLNVHSPKHVINS